MRRNIALTSALALMGALALAPAVSAQDPTEVKMWFHGGVGAESDALAAQVAAFNDSQSEI